MAAAHWSWNEMDNSMNFLNLKKENEPQLNTRMDTDYERLGKESNSHPVGERPSMHNSLNIRVNLGPSVVLFLNLG